MIVVLFGWKRVGKTTFGNLFAKEKNLPFIDTDEKLLNLYSERHQQKLSCLDIIHRHGEKFFREMEKEVLLSIQEQKEGVIALGGGTLLVKERISLLPKNSLLVQLKLSYDSLKERLFKNPLPYFLENTDFENLYLERTLYFDSLSSVVIDVEKEPVLQKLHILWEEKSGK